VDLCRAAAYIDPEAGEVPLRMVAADLAHEIKASKMLFAGYETSSNTFYISTASHIMWWLFPETFLGIIR
jgi:hypothetical protein